ncbi:hypothetical protein [Chengkuizengella axinellae]|uniref:Uncharacterized protein n=1 Tax=Chengkuizengella axinellae TaxID=3064388 RepID=A0ABT9IYT5_9BACL|nr:hypothetical protein [Chengkuizengella sp. 2205SS18-9]MDP5274475.1 hypothetical protein [Chengkuizengella sp. 2205SS18-9]
MILEQIESRLKQSKYRIQFDGIGVRGEETGDITLFFFGPSVIRFELATNEKDTTGKVPIIGGCGVTD